MSKHSKKQAIPTVCDMPAPKEYIFPINAFIITKKNAFESMGKRMQAWQLSNEASSLGFRVGTDMCALKFTVVGTRGDVNFTYYNVVYDASGEDIVGWEYMPETAADSQILDQAHVKVFIHND